MRSRRPVRGPNALFQRPVRRLKTRTVTAEPRARVVPPLYASRRVRSDDYPEGISLVGNAYLVHHDPEIYPDPYEFRPERFLDESPGTYTWIPFGGGRRRCLGASFAQLEMKLVLKAVFARSSIKPVSEGMETPRRRSITISPRAGATIVLGGRQPTRPAAEVLAA